MKAPALARASTLVPVFECDVACVKESARAWTLARVVGSGAGDGQRQSFVLAYIRPKVIRKPTLLGFKEKLDPKHYSDIEIKTAAEVEVLLNAFLESRTEVLDARFG